MVNAIVNTENLNINIKIETLLYEWQKNIKLRFIIYFELSTSELKILLFELYN